jgi:hypothetical protein
LTYFKIWWRHLYPSMWLFISLMCSPSSLGYGGYSLLHNFLFNPFFVGTRNPSSNQFCLPSTKQINSAPRWKEEHQLAPSPLISTNLFTLLHVLDPKEIPTRRNFGFLVIFSRNHPPKILLTLFLDINLLRASFL